MPVAEPLQGSDCRGKAAWNDGLGETDLQQSGAVQLVRFWAATYQDRTGTVMQDPLAHTAHDPAADPPPSMRPHHHEFTVEARCHVNDVWTRLSTSDVKSHPVGRQIDRQGGQILLDPLFWDAFGEWDGETLLEVLAPWLPNVQQVEKGIARLSLLGGEWQRGEASLIKVDRAKHRT